MESKVHWFCRLEIKLERTLHQARLLRMVSPHWESKRKKRKRFKLFSFLFLNIRVRLICSEIRATLVFHDKFLHYLFQIQQDAGGSVLLAKGLTAFKKETVFNWLSKMNPK